ncbi:hypothetical protein DAPPUDRAFT_332353 [Daphnia pulex]|uniref:Uncharacterized protein n=1 Tax=Daphnia pulex TaxID=6669 RepID=E9HPR5_DAPPU|nr:hypothetical protein DAPPUDRAFT_332353 [Daphnia pulex]|eukprot:EFX66265.1 hypothetical protein DAPPUDRAFT_332353 [Daphnia pulex]
MPNLSWNEELAAQMTEHRQKGKIAFVGELIYHDGSINLTLLHEVQDIWNSTRRVQQNDGYFIYLPMELSYEECLDARVRNFYLTHTGAAQGVYRPGDNVKVALSKQPGSFKRSHTFTLKNELLRAIDYDVWTTARELMAALLDFDPLNRRTPSPPPSEDWDCAPSTSREDEEQIEKRARLEEDQAAPHVADPNFDWNTIRQLPPAADLQE